MEKKVSVYLILMAFMMVMISGCASESKEAAIGNSNKDTVKVVATLFPQYDFARHIAGDKATVIMLLPPGVESHSYEPKPSDIIMINNADLFIYTGKYMEIWAERILEGMDNPKGRILDVSKGINLETTENIEGVHHHDDEDGEEEHHGHQYDPHIWTDPILAKVMVNNIVESLCELDPTNASYYKSNGENYNTELDQLDAEFREIVENGARDEIVFGSKFALYYFTKQYGLSYEAAFDSCSDETEPSAKIVAHLIDEIKEENIPVIYYAEIGEPKVAKSISDETGAKILLFHSCHNITKKELDQGATYLSLMKQNAKNLKEGLN